MIVAGENSREGQISIDYLAGALIFFGSLVFLVSNVMTTLPAFSQAQQRDELTLSAWSMSEVVMEDRGHWETGARSGSDWHNHKGKIEVIGVAGDDGISREKVEALTALNQTWLRSALSTEKKLNIEFTEVVDVHTDRTFQKGSPPSFLTEPSYPGNTADTIHFGAKKMEGVEKRFLLEKNSNLGWYNRLRVSDDWDFTDSEMYNLTSDAYVPVGGATYTGKAANTQISEGNLLIFRREMGRTGDVPEGSVEDIVSVDRYGVMDGNVVEVTFRVWE